ncbi:MAG: hypothetical protein ABFD75_14545 [Smithella sp.]
MALKKTHMLRCASSSPGLRRGRLAAYEKVGLIPHDSRALPLIFVKRHIIKCMLLARRASGTLLNGMC